MFYDELKALLEVKMKNGEDGWEMVAQSCNALFDFVQSNAADPKKDLQKLAQLFSRDASINGQKSYVLVTGNILEGINLTGPFDYQSTAYAYTNQFNIEGWVLAKLKAPLTQIKPRAYD